MKRLWRLLSVVLLVALGLGASNVLAQRYPSKPIRVVVPMSPGGQMDTITRLIAQIPP